MKVTIDVPNSAVMLIVNALYQVGDDLRLTSASLVDPGDGEHVVLDAFEEVKQ